MAEYRWNECETAAGYDAAAEQVHPYYEEMQETILSLLPRERFGEGLLADVGGGSGRLVERFLTQFPQGRAVVLDQSGAFLGLAAERLQRFGERAKLVEARLQDDWAAALPAAPDAIVSMSAIHHLDPVEKRRLYARCHDALAEGGVLLNGDEIRDPDDETYLGHLQRWAEHMQRIVAENRVSPAMAAALEAWIRRNVGDFGSPRASGDDCHETVAAQLQYLREAGFGDADAPWEKEMWAVLRGAK